MFGRLFIIAIHLLLKPAAILLISPEQKDYQHNQTNTQKCQYDPVCIQEIYGLKEVHGQLHCIQKK
jgi:hypothetical protein